VGEVTVSDFLSVDDLQHFGATPGQLMDEWGVGVLAESIEITMMKKFLKASVDSASALISEETKELRSRDQTVFVRRSKECEIPILKCKRRTVGGLRSTEARQTTNEGRNLCKSGG
jgi:hypothetical protein